MVNDGLAMRHGKDLTWSQVVMAANTPMLLKAGLVEGNTEAGVLASGQVAGILDDLPSCAELIDAIVAEASSTFRRLSAFIESDTQRSETADQGCGGFLHSALMKTNAAILWEFGQDWSVEEIDLDLSGRGRGPGVMGGDRPVPLRRTRPHRLSPLARCRWSAATRGPASWPR